MKASELIYRLARQIDENGDLEVFLYTDHGQEQSSCQSCALTEADEDSSIKLIELY